MAEPAGCIVPTNVRVVKALGPVTGWGADLRVLPVWQPAIRRKLPLSNFAVLSQKVTFWGEPFQKLSLLERPQMGYSTGRLLLAAMVLQWMASADHA